MLALYFLSNTILFASAATKCRPSHCCRSNRSSRSASSMQHAAPLLQTCLISRQAAVNLEPLLSFTRPSLSPRVSPNTLKTETFNHGWCTSGVLDYLKSLGWSGKPVNTLL